MGRHFPRITAIVLQAALAQAALAEFVYQSQTREVEALIDWSSGVASDLDNAFGFDSSNLSVAASYPSPSGAGNVTATQNSVLAPHRISVSGGVGIDNPFFAHENAFYMGRTVFDVSFLVDEAKAFTFNASFTGLWDTGGTNTNHGSFSLLFTGPGGAILSDTRVTPGPGSGGVFNPPLVYAAEGSFVPGLHSIRIAFTDELAAVGNMSNPPQSWGVGGGGDAGFSLTLTAPEPAAGLLALLLTALLPAARRR